MFELFPEDTSTPRNEENILEYWDRTDVFRASVEARNGAPRFTFYEGPPTVNGKPGIHHVISRTIKDVFCRYKTMRGFQVRRQAGWDTHGLPIEIEAEKRLGITDKSQIEQFGVARFNAECRAIVDENIGTTEGWRKFSRRMAYWLDYDEAYITCSNEYVESVWWALKQFYDRGLIVRGFKVIPMSPTLGTPLSSHELSLNYRDVRDPNVYVKLRITESAHHELIGSEVLVWTTTPWTLVANVALAVGPDVDYVLVSVRADSAESEQQLLLAEKRLEILSNEYRILHRYKGRDLSGTRYEQIFPYIVLDQNLHPNVLSVLSADFVTTEDGSGIVHIAPAFGQDDFEMSKQFNLPMVQPVTPVGRFTEEITEFAGRTVKTFTYSDHTEEGADRDIVKTLKGANKIYKSSFDYLHSYPHCWRTDNPVIYYARESWFITSPAYREELVALNKTIGWRPPEIGEGRFGNWLDEVKDWALSRDRYWGTPLPIWVNDDGEAFAVGSAEELANGMYETAEGKRIPVSQCGEKIDMHRPFVDRIVFERNGKLYRRTKEVIDVWFDSGCVPFAQFHYPFENKEEFENSFPADFVAEGIDQTRGWFYTMHNIAVALFGSVAYKNVVVNDLLLDKAGQKMSKSRGNTVDPFALFDTYGADAIRWYLMASSPVWKTKLFNEEDISRTVIADFFRSVTNTYAFFAMYANVDQFAIEHKEVSFDMRPEIDRWILSRLNTILKKYIEFMEDFDVTGACRELQEFFIEDVSNWYVRRNRRRFWKGEYDSDKKAAYQTLHEVMYVVAQMIAPVVPFLAEQLFLRLRQNENQKSIHCIILQQPNDSRIDEELERRMRQAQLIVSLVRSLREKARIKTRQPLRRILLPVVSPSIRREIQSVEEIILEEVNVKMIEYVSDDVNIVRKSSRPNFKVIGKKYGAKTQQVSNAIKSLTNEQVRKLEQSSVLAVNIGDATIQVDYEDVDIVSEDIEGWLVASENGMTVALDTEIDEGLEREGLAREFVSKVQKIRKDSGYEVTDRISLHYNSDDSTSEALQALRSYIVMETLAITLERGERSDGTDLEINGRHVNVRVERV